MSPLRYRRATVAARGFTLQEASLTIVIVAYGFLGAMELFAACTAENQKASQVTTAQMLCGNIQELTTGLLLKDPFYATATWGPEAGEVLSNYNDLDDFDGLSFNPPIDATRASVPELSQYTQVVSVMPVDPNRPGANGNPAAPDIAKGIYTGAVRVRVSVLYRRTPADPPVEVLKTAWVRLDD